MSRYGRRGYGRSGIANCQWPTLVTATPFLTTVLAYRILSNSKCFGGTYQTLYAIRNTESFEIGLSKVIFSRIVHFHLSFSPFYPILSHYGRSKKSIIIRPTPASIAVSFLAKHPCPFSFIPPLPWWYSSCIDWTILPAQMDCLS